MKCGFKGCGYGFSSDRIHPVLGLCPVHSKWFVNGYREWYGLPCKEHSCKQTTLYGEYCNEHLSERFGVHVRASGLGPSAGMGLFASRDLPRGYLVGTYKGDTFPVQTLARVDADTLWVYAVRVGNSVINAWHSNSCHVRFANDARANKQQNTGGRSTVKNNCRFQGKHLVTNSAVKSGNELLVPYGSSYWNKTTLKHALPFNM